MLQSVSPCERGQNLTLPAQHLPYEGRASFGTSLFKAKILKHLPRIIDRVKQSLLVVRRDPLVKDRFHQRPQTARGVVENVLKLLVLAVHIADDVHGAFRQVQNSLEIGYLHDGSVIGRKTLGQSAQSKNRLGAIP